MPWKFVALSAFAMTWLAHSANAVPINLSQGLPVASYASSSTYGGSAQAAFNGGHWNSGTYSGEIQVDLGTSYSINDIGFNTDISTRTGTNYETRTYQISTKNNISQPWTLSKTFTVNAVTGIRQDFNFSPIDAEYVKIGVPSSTSWVELSSISIYSGLAPEPVAVSEPASMALLAMGLICLGLTARRQRD